MIKVRRRSSVAALTVTAAVITACTGAAAGHAATVRPSGATTVQSATAQPGTAKRATVRVAVPAGLGGGAFATPRTLTVPAGWTAKVWARVAGARMEAWAPQKTLLVSVPGNGTIVQLTPNKSGTGTEKTLLSGLSQPQGMAFAKLNGKWVLYVAESSQIDRYPWGAKGISGKRAVIVRHLPDLNATGDDVHRVKDLAVTANGTIYFMVGSSTNAQPRDRTMKPQRAVIMSVQPTGKDLKVVERGVRNGEGLSVAPNGVVWTAVNERDNIEYPFHSTYEGTKNPFGQIIQAYVNNHPPDEVVPVTQGRDVGWPYCDPDQDKSKPAGSLANIPLVANAVTNPGGTKLNCSKLTSIQVGLPAHSAPLGLSFLESSKLPGSLKAGAVVAVHGSWDRQPPRAPGVLWMAWNAKRDTLEPATTLIGGFETNGTFWGRPVDAVAGPDGALYVSDDSAGAIYRFAPPK